ncbi:hypothetical protein pdam_00020688, partial [Pocillopora damicornis]
MGSELLDVKTFGTLQGRRKTYDLVALTLSTEVENIKITALSLEYYSLPQRYLQEAGMNLRQWTSNSEALNRIAQEDHIQADPTTKILGLTWNSTIHKIQEITSSQTWRFCPTSMNPADLITRGVSTIIFNDKKKLWFEGPPGLSEPEEQWPPYPQNLFHEALQSLQMEIVTNVADDPNILNIIDITRYSTLVHLLRVTARVINFARKWRKRKVYSETFTAKDIVEGRN